MTAQDLDLLAKALRARAATIDEFAEVLGTDREALVAQLHRLEAQGFLTLVEDTISYRRPDVTITDLAERTFQDLARDMQDTLQQTQEALESLPGLLQAWREGSADESSLPLEVLHGPWAATGMWRLQFSRAIPRLVDLCIPDAGALLELRQDSQASYWGRHAGEPLEVRLLMSTTDAARPEGQEAIAKEHAHGVQIRMHPDLPSFFWVADGSTVAVPLEWGEGWPSAVIATQSPPLASILGWVYERLWREAVPVTGTEQPWDGMLRLMSQGLTMQAAASSLGLTPRTGRRRVAEAMVHYGVKSHFSLAAAWSTQTR